MVGILFGSCGNSGKLFLAFQDISYATHCLDQLALLSEVDLLSQMPDEGVHRIGFNFLLESPHALDNRGSGNGVARAPHQEFEYTVFRSCEVQSNTGAPYLVRCWVEQQIVHLQAGFGRLRRPPGDSAQARKQNAEGEGFGKVVVGAGI